MLLERPSLLVEQSAVKSTVRLVLFGIAIQMASLALLACSQIPRPPTYSVPANLVRSEAPQTIDRHRDAEPKEIYGAWEWHDHRLEWPWQYVVVREDGMTGWVAAKTQLRGVTRSALARIITNKSLADRHVEGWNRARISKGEVVDLETSEGHYVFWVVEQVGSESSCYSDASRGDIVMAALSNPPPVPNPLPSPLICWRLRRIPD